MLLSETPPPDNIGLLKEPVFRAWWTARLVSQTAQAALLYGLLILITDRTDRSIYASLYVVCSIVPSLLLGLVGGWLADRLPQRALLIVLNLVRAGLVAAMLRPDANLSIIFGVTLGIWIVHQFFSPTESATVARIVHRDRLSDATALANFALTLAQLFGMVIIAPLMLKLPDERALFAVIAALYVLAAVFHIRMGRLPDDAPRTTRKPPLDLRRGWQVVVTDRPAFGALIDAVLIGVGMSTLVVIVPYYLVDVLDTDAGNTVFVFAPAVIGLVAGLQLASALGRMIGHGRLAMIGLIGFAICIALLGLIDQFIEVLRESRISLAGLEDRLGIPVRISATMLLSIPAGFFSAVTNVAARTVLLDRSPSDTRGQVLATQSTLSNAIALVPTITAGLAIDLIDVRPVAFAVALLLLIGAIIGRRIGSEHRAGDEALVEAPVEAPVVEAPSPNVQDLKS
ncbi:MAG: MFS transporter [Chloroflexota bacterium]|nr:MFS transporter [Chloroflexota bacterium]